MPNLILPLQLWPGDRRLSDRSGCDSILIFCAFWAYGDKMPKPYWPRWDAPLRRHHGHYVGTRLKPDEAPITPSEALAAGDFGAPLGGYYPRLARSTCRRRSLSMRVAAPFCWPSFSRCMAPPPLCCTQRACAGSCWESHAVWRPRRS